MILIDDVLKFVTGREIDVVDMYRIGRYVDGKCRQFLLSCALCGIVE